MLLALGSRDGPCSSLELRFATPPNCAAVGVLVLVERQRDPRGRHRRPRGDESRGRRRRPDHGSRPGVWWSGPIRLARMRTLFRQVVAEADRLGLADTRPCWLERQRRPLGHLVEIGDALARP